MKYLKKFESFEDQNLEHNFDQIITELESDNELKLKLKEFVEQDLNSELEEVEESDYDSSSEFNESFSFKSIWDKVKKLFTISPETKIKIGNFLQSLGITTIVGGTLVSQIVPTVSQFYQNQLFDKTYQALLNSDFGRMYVERYGHLDQIHGGVYLMLAGIATSIVTGVLTMKTGERITKSGNDQL